MKSLTYKADGAVKETTDRVVLGILEDFDCGWIGAGQASAYARVYLLSNDAGWKDDQRLENLDVYAAVVGHVYSEQSLLSHLYKFPKQSILRLLRHAGCHQCNHTTRNAARN